MYVDVGRRHIGKSIGNLFSLRKGWRPSINNKKKSQRVYIHLFVLLEFFFLHVYTTNERQAGTKEEKRELSLFQLYMDAFTSPG
jgi:hypothetical protein